ncbi:MAG: hypothetical protein HY301_10925 [Verrucomicrobia bacterium]|nr:hypothetical protein [Verrucomicrobiota bacterium]
MNASPSKPTTARIGLVAAATWLAILLPACQREEPVALALLIATNPTNTTEATVILTASGKKSDGIFTAKVPAERWEPVLTLAIADGSGRHVPLLARYEARGATLTLTPRFPLAPGQTYEAVFHPASLRVRGFRFEPAELVTHHTVPAVPTTARPVLRAIHPTAGTLPANHLKFYLVFSEPMQRGEFLRHIRLLDDSGAEVTEPFRETELWSPDGLRLTLWFHPGRQKTGVNLNVEIGPVLEAGRRYRLVVDDRWLSQNGLPLTAPFEKPFAAGAPDHTQPDLATWTLNAPRAGTRDALLAEFPEPLDWALLKGGLSVRAAAGDEVPGTVSVGAEEKSWSFTPAAPWPAGEFELVAPGMLEDLAGNTLARPFEVDVSKPSPDEAPREFVRRFSVQP